MSGDIKTTFLSGDEEHRDIVILLSGDVGGILKVSPEPMLRLRRAVYGLVNAPKTWWDRLKHGFTSCTLDPCASVLVKQKSELSLVFMWLICWEEVMKCKREFDFGAWDVGAMRFKGRELTQMANYEIMIDMEHCKHDLQQIEVSKSDNAKLERLLSAKEMTCYRGGFASVG